MKRVFNFKDRTFTIYSLKSLEEKGVARLAELPFSIRVLIENLLRNLDGRVVKEDDIGELISRGRQREIAFYPSRVILQDFTGVPCIVDLASMRDAMARLGREPDKINPLIPVDLIIDHSIQVDYSGSSDSIERNMELEYSRNTERYSLLKWAQGSFKNLRVFPPGSGIIHQVNLEYISGIVMQREVNGETILFPETLLGTDSHTTMINSLGIVGWGVGGIEAEAVMLGQPYYMTAPDVVGVRLNGDYRGDVTATDIVLAITELLRRHNVVGRFVEFFGPALRNLSIPDRATISNMAPEYGATMGFFPIDDRTIEYMRLTGRKAVADMVEAYAREQTLFYEGDEPEYNEVIEFDISSVTPSIAGPSRPHERINLMDAKERFYQHIITRKRGGDRRKSTIRIDDEEFVLSDGSIVIAAITSCTNTSNPSLMIGAGLLAKRAVEMGLCVKPYVKTSFAPGSRVVAEYMRRSGLLVYLERLNFHIVGYGCTTCIGNSGPLHPMIEDAIKRDDLIVSAVISGNRNFEARIHPLVKTNYLASPPLVVAFAIAGRIDIDLEKEPIGRGSDGRDVFLKDILPSRAEVMEVANLLTEEMFSNAYKDILHGDKHWQSLNPLAGKTFGWDESSTYIKKPPFFEYEVGAGLSDIEKARALLVLGDFVTTDHISPAGSIPVDSPAGRYLLEKGVEAEDFNTYGSRRGNHEVMIRGTFANLRIKNRLVAPREGGLTLKMPEGEEMPIYDAAMRYMDEGVPLIILAGKGYGAGSSRDWAAKGTYLLGVRAVIAESFERIHRSNLVGMGVLPLCFKEGEGIDTLGIRGDEEFYIYGIKDISPGKVLDVVAIGKDGKRIRFSVVSRLDTWMEVEYLKNGGILHYVLRILSKRLEEKFKSAKV
ncbi:MAG: aconitate hydratase AcnA [Thermodesulfovibrionia bacterium]